MATSAIEMMSLFQRGTFKLSSGGKADWKIECDALTNEDWQTLAALIVRRHSFYGVTGVPRGGLRLAALLQPHATPTATDHMIVDDVYTTGKSIRRMRDELALRPDGDGKHYVGVVIFARAPITRADAWVSPMFQMWRASKSG